ncbi:defensin-like protein 182 [Rosa rugosa]|uniref:defensin-like protein 182 n=1 Tax=Rosa rugosa TaxID=74645 RepID=UPI002B404A19|nr:defensin-like protein 182 [Rosa rugosa]
MLITVKGDICSEGLGECGNDCDERCRSKHLGQNPQGSCETEILPPLCTCNYECGSLPPSPPEPPKRDCNAGLGPCSADCSDDCCNSECASQFNQRDSQFRMCNIVVPISVYTGGSFYHQGSWKSMVPNDDLRQ